MFKVSIQVVVGVHTCNGPTIVAVVMEYVANNAAASNNKRDIVAILCGHCSEEMGREEK